MARPVPGSPSAATTRPVAKALSAWPRASAHAPDSSCREPLPGSFINGRLALGENIADLAGLLVAHDAYRLSLQGREAPVIDGFTGDQRFFIAYAQKSRNKWSEQLQRVVMESDPHSPDYARVNEVLRNFDPWYKAFNVTKGDKLYVAPKDRVRIW